MSITTALKARRESLRNSEGGFTLIELLVVVIIIGVLAAIAIPIYIGVQNNAKDKAAQSDLTNARTAIVAYYGDTGAFPGVALLTSSTTKPVNNAGGGLGSWGFPAKSGTNADAAVTYSGSGTAVESFCLKATSDSGAANIFYLTTQGQPTKDKPGTC